MYTLHVGCSRFGRRYSLIWWISIRQNLMISTFLKKKGFETIDFPDKIIFLKNMVWNHWFSEQNYFWKILFGKSMVSKPIFQKKLLLGKSMVSNPIIFFKKNWIYLTLKVPSLSLNLTFRGICENRVFKVSIDWSMCPGFM